MELIVGQTYETPSGRQLKVTDITETSVFYDSLTPGGNRTYVTHRLPIHEFRRLVGI
jgi:hypothetical protein